jgi:hypothetical protein
MHLVCAKVGIQAGRTEEAIGGLKADIIPQVKQAPGFVKGTWCGNDEIQHCLVMFETEDRARGMAQMVTAEPGDPSRVMRSRFTSCTLRRSEDLGQEPPYAPGRRICPS